MNTLPFFHVFQKVKQLANFFRKSGHFSLLIFSFYIVFFSLFQTSNPVIIPNFLNPNHDLAFNSNLTLSSNISTKLAATEGIGTSPTSCGEKTLTIANIITPGAFFPVIPCALDSAGRVQPLSPALIPDIMIRLFGMIASLTFYLFFGILILSGVMFIWDGISGKTRKMAERNLYDTIFALILIFGTYTILITILRLLNFDFAKTNIQFFDF